MDLMDLDAIKRELEEFEERFQQWIEPIDRVCVTSLYKVNKGGYTLADHEREVEQIARSQFAKYDPYQDIYRLLDGLCAVYLDPSSQQRAEIRSAVSGKEGIWSGLIAYAYRAAKRLESPADKEWLRLGLAAISIENCGADFRDTLMALAELWLAGERAGIDPEPYFKEVAELSSCQAPSGGTTTLRDMLSGFRSYAVLQERRNRPQGVVKEVAPWERRIYHFDRYTEEITPWWKRILGLWNRL